MNIDFIDDYKKIKQALTQIIVTEKLSNSDLTFNTAKTSNDKYWILMLLYRNKKMSNKLIVKYDENDRDNLIFSVYLNKFKKQVVVKAPILLSYDGLSRIRMDSIRKMIMNNLTYEFNKKNLKNIKFDEKIQIFNYYYGYGTLNVKILLRNDYLIEDLYNVYDIVITHNLNI